MLILLTACVAVMSMGIAYAALSNTLEISGSAKILSSSTEPVEIVDVVDLPVDPNCSANILDASTWESWNNSGDTGGGDIGISGNIEDLNCSLDYQVTVVNRTDDIYVIYDINGHTTNPYITYESSIVANTVAAAIPAGGQLTFTISTFIDGNSVPPFTEFTAGIYLYWQKVEPPTLIMSNSSRNFELFRGSNFNLDARVSALDDIDGDITSEIVKTCTTLAGQSVTCPTQWRDLPRGDYVFYYDVTNSFGLSATQLAVNVNLWDLKKIESGQYHSVVVASNGNLYIWGYNGGYRLGLGDVTRRPTPLQHPTFANIDVVDASSCYDSGHAVDADGNLWSWGTNGSYSLGDGTATTRTTPVKIDPPSGEKYIQVSCFYDTAAALTDAGDVYTWGWAAYGGTGFGTATTITRPTKLPQLSGIVKIEMGYYNGAAIDLSGKLYTWSTNAEGQLGLGFAGANVSQGVAVYYNLPNSWQNITNAQKICYGGLHAVYVGQDGIAKSWGTNYTGRLGNGTASTNSFTPFTFSVGNVSSCMSHYYGSGIITSSGQAYLFGNDTHGEMGQGTYGTSRNTPTLVTGVTNVTGGDMQLDGSHLIQDGITVYGFGYNGNGELGLGTTGTYNPTITAWDTSNLPLMNVVEW